MKAVNNFVSIITLSIVILSCFFLFYHKNKKNILIQENKSTNRINNLIINPSTDSNGFVNSESNLITNLPINYGNKTDLNVSPYELN